MSKEITTSVATWLHSEMATDSPKRALSPTKSLPSTLFLQPKRPEVPPTEFQHKLEQILLDPGSTIKLSKSCSVPTYLGQLSDDADESDCQVDDEERSMTSRPQSIARHQTRGAASDQIPVSSGVSPGNHHPMDYPNPTRKRSKKSSMSSAHSSTSTWSLDSPFISLMSEARARKISDDRISNLSAKDGVLLQNRKVSETPRQLSVPEEIEMNVIPAQAQPKYTQITTPKSRQRQRNIHTVREAGTGRVHMRNRQMRSAQGSWVFENYQQQIFERTSQPWHQPTPEEEEAEPIAALPDKLADVTSAKPPLKPTTRLSLPRSPRAPNRPFTRRTSWNDMGTVQAVRSRPQQSGSSDSSRSASQSRGRQSSGEEDMGGGQFRRHAPSRSTWTAGKKSGGENGEDLFESNRGKGKTPMTMDDEQGGVGKRTGIRRSFQKLGKIFGQSR